MKEVLQALEARIRSPYMGYFTLCFIAFNWKPVFYLFASTESPAARISFFEENTGLWTLLLWPAFIGAIITVCYPWVSLLFVYFCEKPTQFRNSMQAKTEHALLVEKQRLQEERRKILANAENQIIDQAKRDQVVEQIQDDSIKDKVKSEIQDLRQKEGIDKKFAPNELLEMAAQFRQRAGQTPSHTSDYSELKRKATELEDKAHQMMLG